MVNEAGPLSLADANYSMAVVNTGDIFYSSIYIIIFKKLSLYKYIFKKLQYLNNLLYVKYFQLKSSLVMYIFTELKIPQGGGGGKGTS